MSFGCGTGTKDQAILIISSRLPEEATIVYHAVDPSARELEKFKKAVKNGNERKEPFKKVHFDFFTLTYKDFIQNKDVHLPSKANMILFIDSLRHLTTSTEDALVHCYNNLLAQNGVILITLRNNQDVWFTIRKKQKPLPYHSGRRKDRQTAWLEFSVALLEYSFDITECFDSNSKDGKNLLECFACFFNVKDEVDSDPEKLINFLQESKSASGAKHLLKGNQGVLIIYKQE